MKRADRVRLLKVRQPAKITPQLLSTIPVALWPGFGKGAMIMEIHQCQCPRCTANEDHPDRAFHHRLNVLLSRLDEPQGRWLAALEAQRIGRGGDRLLALVTGLNVETIRRGRRELEASL